MLGLHVGVAGFGLGRTHHEFAGGDSGQRKVTEELALHGEDLTRGERQRLLKRAAGHLAPARVEELEQVVPRLNRLGGNPCTVLISLLKGIGILVESDVALAAEVHFGLQLRGGEVHLHAVADVAQLNLNIIRAGLHRVEGHVDHRERMVEHQADRGAARHADVAGKHQVAGRKAVGIGLLRKDVEGDIERIGKAFVVGIVGVEVQRLVRGPLRRGVVLQCPRCTVVDQLGIVKHVSFALKLASELRCEYTDGVTRFPCRPEFLVHIGTGKRIELRIELDGNRGKSTSPFR